MLSEISIYPNPANKKIKFTGLNRIENINVKIYSVSGELMGIVLLNDEKEIDIRSLPKGIYFINFNTKENEGEYSIKFIKE